MKSETPQESVSSLPAPGFLERLRANTPNVIINNAPRVVALLKAGGSLSMFMSKNRTFSIAGGGFFVANAIMLLFGSKKTEGEKEKLQATSGAAQENLKGGYFSDYATKLFNPRKYPIESATGVAMTCSSLWTLSGLLNKGGFSPARLFGGALSLGSDLNMILTKERIGEPRANPHPKGSFSYYVTELKNRPVFTSSMLNFGCDVAMISGGLHEYRKGKEPSTLLVGLFLMVANLFQAIFVNKNDYNIVRKETAATVPKAANESAPPHPQEEPKREASRPAWGSRVNSQSADMAFLRA